MNKTFSIITPSFNQAQFLPECLESVMGQTVIPVEHFVIDPGSTDGSREIAAEYPYVTLIAEPDDGQADAICKGFSRSNGDILAWLNSDDRYPDKTVLLEVAKRFNQADRPDVVYGRAAFMNEAGEKLKDAYINPRPETFSESFQYEVGIIQPSVFIKREVFEAIGGPPIDMHFTLDYEYWVRISEAGFKWGFLDKLLSEHRWWGGMKTASKRVESIYEHFDTVKKHFGYVHHRWIERQASCLATGADCIIVNPEEGANEAPDEDDIKRRLHLEANGDYPTLSKLRTATDGPMGETASQMKSLGLRLRSPYYATESESEGTELTGFARQGDEDRPTAWRRSKGESITGTTVYGYEVEGSFKGYYASEWLDDQLVSSRQRLSELAGSRQSDVCIIVGNGPSLNKTDFDLFEGNDVIISNFATLDPKLLALARFHTVSNFLVAKQGSHQFNRLDSLTKVYPYWLSQYLLPDENTIYLDALLTPEFSTDVTDSVSWRSTVSFLNMQLAYSLGYKKVLLVGFDHSYKQDVGAKEGDLIQQDEDDENHFLKGYFKGKVWQAADVDLMEEMYLKAKDAFESDGREIVNCTVGGKLEVFRRANLKMELGHHSPDPFAEKKQSEYFPRVLILDATLFGGLSATGKLKERLFLDWPQDRLMQLYAESSKNMKIWYGDSEREWDTSRPLCEAEVRTLIFEFMPEVVYFRPVDFAPKHYEWAKSFIEETGLPTVFHIMDDWPERMRHDKPKEFQYWDNSLREVIALSSQHLSIGKMMSKAFESRYGVPFKAVANGIDLEEWNPSHRNRAKGAPMVVRYTGGLAPDMTLDTIKLIGECISELSTEIPISLEIYTMKYWREPLEEWVCLQSGVSIHEAIDNPDDYRQCLSGADLLLIGYNFDEVSNSYVRYSVGNKLPECVNASVPLLVVGPEELATVSLADEIDGIHTLHRPDRAEIKTLLRKIYESPDWAIEEALKAKKQSEEELSLPIFRERLYAALKEAKSLSSQWSTPSIANEACADFNETKFVSTFLGWQKIDGVALSVGQSESVNLNEKWKTYSYEKGLSFGSGKQQASLGKDEALSAFCRDHEISEVTFLNISKVPDSLPVINGILWDELKPEAVIVDIEIKKPLQGNANFQKISGFLADRGYAVFLSEWYPHSSNEELRCWKRLSLYPCEPTREDASCRIIAFLKQPALSWISDYLGNGVVIRNGLDSTLWVEEQAKRIKKYSTQHLLYRQNISKLEMKISNRDRAITEQKLKYEKEHQKILNRDRAILQQKENVAKEKIKVKNRDRAINDLKAKLELREVEYRAVSKEISELRKLLKELR